MNLRSNKGLRWSAGALVAASAAVLLVLSSLGSTAEAQSKKPVKFIGAQKCKTCHSSDDTGNQFAALSKMKHAHAFEVLGTDEAKKQGKEKNIEDPQKADECLKCHVTGFGAAENEIAKGFDKTLGVQCESCHGPGEAHMKARMAAAAEEDPNVPHVFKGVPEGEIVHLPDMAVCTKCHNKESPNYKEFCFCKMKKEIRHLNPKRQRSDAEKAALAACECKDECACKKECCKDGHCTELAK